MGTRINILFDHHLPDWTDRDESLRVLSTTLTVAQRLAAYWTDGVLNDSPDNERWVAEPLPPPETSDYCRYSGPGPLFVDINRFAVRVRTGGRWRGFLSIQPLRTIHILAFESLANAFSAATARIFPDNDFFDDAFCAGGDSSKCSAVLDERFGNPVPLQEPIDPKVANETDSGCPLLQYVYPLQ